jgi:hypothetical protein
MRAAPRLTRIKTALMSGAGLEKFIVSPLTHVEALMNEITELAGQLNAAKRPWGLHPTVRIESLPTKLSSPKVFPLRDAVLLPHAIPVAGVLTWKSISMKPSHLHQRLFRRGLVMHFA